MFSARADVNGPLSCVWPQIDPDIITLGDAYITCEGRVPIGLRLALPAYAQMLALLEAAKSAADTAVSSEAQRAISATDLANAMEQAKRLLDDALKQLKGRYSKNPAQLQVYNLSTKVGARGDVLVSRPTNDKGWARFLNGYATQQAALPEADRISDPPLAQLQQLDQIVSAAQANRVSGRTQREIGVQNRSAAATRLLDHLQLAAFALVVTRFDGHVVNELQQWGFTIEAKTKPDQPATPDQPAA